MNARLPSTSERTQEVQQSSEVLLEALEAYTKFPKIDNTGASLRAPDLLFQELIDAWRRYCLHTSALAGKYYSRRETDSLLAELISVWREHCSEFKGKSPTERLEICISKAKARVSDKTAKKALDEEIEFFNAELDRKLRRYVDKYVAIKHHRVIAVGDSYGEVSEKVKRTPYAKERCVLIRKVGKEKPIYFVSVPLSAE